MAVVNSEAGQFCLLFNSEAERKVTEVTRCKISAQVNFCLQGVDVSWVVRIVRGNGVGGCVVGEN